MKKILGTLAAIAVLAIGAPAYAELMDSTFGNTVTVSMGDNTMSYYFNEDGTFSAASSDGATAEGTWTLDGTTLCVMVGDQTSCNEIEDHEVGDSWEESDEQGTVTISIVEGR